MTVELKPETQQLVQEEILSGHVHSIDELIVYGVEAVREKLRVEHSAPRPRKRLYDLLTQPPFADSELVIERQNDCPRSIDLS